MALPVHLFTFLMQQKLLHWVQEIAGEVGVLTVVAPSSSEEGLVACS